MATMSIKDVLNNLYPHKKEFDIEVVQGLLRRSMIDTEIFQNGCAIEFRYHIKNTDAYNSIELTATASIENLYQIIVDDLNQTLRGEI